MPRFPSLPMFWVVDFGSNVLRAEDLSPLLPIEVKNAMRLSHALDSVMVPPGRPLAEVPELREDNPPAEPSGLRIPQDIPKILKKHWRTSAVIFASTLAVITLAIFLVPRTYQSESKLFVRVGRESVTLDPTATTGQNISVYESRENELNSVIDVLQSRVILEQVVDNLSVELLAQGGSASTELTPMKKELLVRSLGSSIDVSHGKKSSVITVTAKARTPELAQQILQEMMATFRKKHLSVNRTEGSFEFFQQQRAQLKTRLTEAREAVQSAKNRYGLVSVEGERKNLEAQVNTLDSALMKNERELGATVAEIESLDAIASRIPKNVLASQVSGFFNDAHEQTRQQLHRLEIEQQQLLVKFTPLHHRVKTLQKRIDAAEAILNARPHEKSQQTQTVNPAYQQLELKRLLAESRRETLQSEQVSLKRQRKELSSALTQLNAGETEIAHLEQQVQLQQASYQAYGEKLEQARIDRELEDERISNVNVVQPATFLPMPISPKRKLIFGFAIVVASISALGYGFIRELLAGNLSLTKSFSG